MPKVTTQYKALNTEPVKIINNQLNNDNTPTPIAKPIITIHKGAKFPLEIKAEYGEKRTFFPDFLCLNLRTRHEFIWEHFGMMDDSEYVASMVRKLKLYEKNGIYIGKNLIISVENMAAPIDAKQIEKIAKQYLQ